MKERNALISLNDKSNIKEYSQVLEEAGFEVYSFGSCAKTLAELNQPFYEIVENPLLLTSFFEVFIKGNYDYGAFTMKRPDILIADLPNLSGEDDFKSLYEKYWTNFGLISAALRFSENTAIISDYKDFCALTDKLKIFDDISEEFLKYCFSTALNRLAFFNCRYAASLMPGSGLKDSPLVFGLDKISDLKYGENPQQKAAVYSFQNISKDNDFFKYAKSLNLNHLSDLKAANRLVSAVSEAACCIFKHGNLVAFSVSDSASKAFEKIKALNPSGLPFSVCVFNRQIDENTAQILAGNNLEIIAAPSFEKKALNFFKKPENVKLMSIKPFMLKPGSVEIFNMDDAIAIQESDYMGEFVCKTFSLRKPSMEESLSFKWAFLAVSHLKPYSAVLFCDNLLIAASSANISVLESIRELKRKFNDIFFDFKDKKIILASSSPLSDSALQEALKIRISAIVESEGEHSLDFISSVNKNNIAFVSVPSRHYKH